MPDKLLYEYAVIRVVPKVERDEFFNVGVILMSKERDFLQMKTQVNETKLKALCPEVDADMINAYLDAWALVCSGKEGGAIGALELRVRFRWLTANRSTIIQSSPIHPGYCDDPEQELEKLFNQLVL